MAFDQVRVRYPNGQQFGPYAMADVKQWAAAGQLPAQSLLVDAGSGEVRALTAFPELLATMPTSFLSKLLPGNAPAVLGYYLGVFSFLGVVACAVPGIVGGLAAVGLGIMGLEQSRQLPRRAGRGHSITAIVCGSICIILGVAVIAFLVAAR